MPAITLCDIGIASPEREAVADNGRDGRVVAVDDQTALHERIVAVLACGCCR